MYLFDFVVMEYHYTDCCPYICTDNPRENTQADRTTTNSTCKWLLETAEMNVSRDWFVRTLIHIPVIISDRVTQLQYRKCADLFERMYGTKRHMQWHDSRVSEIYLSSNSVIIIIINTIQCIYALHFYCLLLQAQTMVSHPVWYRSLGDLLTYIFVI